MHYDQGEPVYYTNLPTRYPEPGKIYRKTDFYNMFHRGVFGNHGPMWFTIDEMLSDPYYQKYRPLVAIRSKVRSGKCVYDIAYSRIKKVYQTFLKEGFRPEDVQFSEMCPKHLQTIQGYVCRTTQHYEMQYTDIKAAMRIALAKKEITATGLFCLGLLKKYLDENSYDWLHTLFDLYPGCTIEFTSFSQPWGVIPNHNTVIWEVRHY